MPLYTVKMNGQQDLVSSCIHCHILEKHPEMSRDRIVKIRKFVTVNKEAHVEESDDPAIQRQLDMMRREGISTELIMQGLQSNWLVTEPRMIVCDEQTIVDYVHHLTLKTRGGKAEISEVSNISPVHVNGSVQHVKTNLEVKATYAFDLKFSEHLASHNITAKSHGLNLILTAIVTGSREVVLDLILRGVDVNLTFSADAITNFGTDIADQPGFKYNLGLVALQTGRMDIIQILLANGFRYIDFLIGWSLQTGQKQLVDELLPRLNLSTIPVEDMKKLMFTIFLTGEIGLFQYIVSRGFKCSQELLDDFCHEQTSQHFWSEPIMREFIKAGLDIKPLAVRCLETICFRSGLSMLDLLVSQGFFAVKRPVDCLLPVIQTGDLSKIEYVFKLGIDDQRDEEAIQRAFVMACAHDARVAEFLSRHIASFGNPEFVEDILSSMLQNQNVAMQLINPLSSRGINFAASPHTLLYVIENSPNLFTAIAAVTPKLDFNTKISTNELVNLMTLINVTWTEISILEFVFFCETVTDVSTVLQPAIRSGLKIDTENLRRKLEIYSSSPSASRALILNRELFLKNFP